MFDPSLRIVVAEGAQLARRGLDASSSGVQPQVRVSAEREGGGSCFVFTLPAARA